MMMRPDGDFRKSGRENFVRLNEVSTLRAIPLRKPSKEISDLLLAPPTPTISVDGKAQYMLVMERSFYPTVEELGQPEFKIAGLRINPNNFSLSRQNFIKKLSLQNIVTGKNITLAGMPNNISALSPSWNPSENKIAFLMKAIDTNSENI